MVKKITNERTHQEKFMKASKTKNMTRYIELRPNLVRLCSYIVVYIFSILHCHCEGNEGKKLTTPL